MSILMFKFRFIHFIKLFSIATVLCFVFWGDNRPKNNEEDNQK